MRSLSLSSPFGPMTSSMSAAATRESHAASGSSSRYTSASAYTARASATRARCPPERKTPLSPISVKSRSGRSERSGISWHARRTRSYLSWSYGWSNRMLSRTDAPRMNGVWAV
mmetsp:Transcript_4924/g.10694  ORF Transcript_4924/g.10694 Transcript_4924/m.10694 type:complete len:114 (-) Transcript_4924:1830-2171(-)